MAIGFAFRVGETILDSDNKQWLVVNTMIHTELHGFAGATTQVEAYELYTRNHQGRLISVNKDECERDYRRKV